MLACEDVDAAALAGSAIRRPACERIAMLFAVLKLGRRTTLDGEASAWSMAL